MASRTTKTIRKKLARQAERNFFAPPIENLSDKVPDGTRAFRITMPTERDDLQIGDIALVAPIDGKFVHLEDGVIRFDGKYVGFVRLEPEYQDDEE